MPWGTYPLTLNWYGKLSAKDAGDVPGNQLVILAQDGVFAQSTHAKRLSARMTIKGCTCIFIATKRWEKNKFVNVKYNKKAHWAF